jgi:hypothetical protein
VHSTCQVTLVFRSSCGEHYDKSAALNCFVGLATGQHRTMELAVRYYGQDNTALLGWRYDTTDRTTPHYGAGGTILWTGQHRTVGLAVRYYGPDNTALWSWRYDTMNRTTPHYGAGGTIL